MIAGGAGASRPLAAAAKATWIAVIALGSGALFALSAFVLHPLAFPLLAAVAALTVVTLGRPEVGIAVALVLVPLGNLALGEGPSWVPLAAWSAFLFSVALVRGDRAPASLGGSTRLGAMGCLYLVLTLVTAVTVTETVEDAFPVVRSLAVGLLLFAATALTVRTREQVRWILGGAAVSVLLVGGYASWQYLTGAESTSSFFTSAGTLVSRAGGGFEQPNQLGGYLVLLLPLAIAGGLTRGRGRLLFALAVLLGVLGIYVSFSRGALIGLVVIPFIFARGSRVLLVALVLVVVGAIAAPGLVEERFVTLTRSGTEVSSRLEIWETSASIWAAQPILGVGPGGFPEAYTGAPVPGKTFLPDTVFEPPPHAHNLELHVLAEAGVVGFVILLVTLVVAARIALRTRRSSVPWLSVCGSAGLAAVVAFVIHNQFDVTLLEGTGSYLWAVLGLISALGSIEEARSETSGEASQRAVPEPA